MNADLQTLPALKHVHCVDMQGLHRMAYWEWGDALNPRVVVCVHGLSRQGRDFDALARVLCKDFRVVCPDVVGRGQSDWLVDPMGYQVPTYVADMVTLAARLNAQRLDWVGTSMGGLIGMGLASLSDRAGNSLVHRLVLNDVGPTVEPVAIERIASYLGADKTFANEDEAADYLWSISQGFGPHTHERWMELTRPQLRARGDVIGMHYDPAIAVPIRAVTPQLAAAGQALLWQRYDSLRCPTLLLRGAESDLLSRETAKAMTERGPRARCVEFEGIGHAPMLGTPQQIAVVRDFLLSP